MKERRYIADTTLYHFGKHMDRDERINTAGMLDQIGINEIAVRVSSLSEFEALRDSVKNASVIVCVGMEPKGLSDIIRYGARAIHFEIPASYPLIYTVYGKNKDWVRRTILECKEILQNSEITVSVGLVDASRAEPSFIENLVGLVSGMTISRLCIKDSLGVQPLSSCAALIKEVRELGYNVGYEGLDQLGMAVPNTIQALKSGASYACCSIAGIGGGCNMNNLLHTANRLFSFDVDRKGADELEKYFRKMYGL
ncbi:MAG: hypothetical protein AB7C97_08575 [Oscillospiraceae bacterium]